MAAFFLLCMVLLGSFAPLYAGEAVRECLRHEVAGPQVKAESWVVARDGARQAWRRHVRQKYGVSWSRWRDAKVRGFVCRPVGRQKECYATALACGRTGLGVNRSGKSDFLGKDRPFISRPDQEGSRKSSRVIASENQSNCKKDIVRVPGGDRANEGLARASARRKWQASVERTLGRAWRKWSLSVGRRFECRRVGTRVDCVALAQPCKPASTTIIAKLPPVLEAREDRSSLQTNGKEAGDLMGTDPLTNERGAVPPEISVPPREDEIPSNMQKEVGKPDLSVPWRQQKELKDILQSEQKQGKRPVPVPDSDLAEAEKAERLARRREEEGEKRKQAGSRTPEDEAVIRRQERSEAFRSGRERSPSGRNLKREGGVSDSGQGRKKAAPILRPYFPDQGFVNRKLAKRYKKRRSGIPLKPVPRSLRRKRFQKEGRRIRRIQRSNLAAKGDRLDKVAPRRGTGTERTEKIKVTDGEALGTQKKKEERAGRFVMTPLCAAMPVEVTGPALRGKRRALRAARHRWLAHIRRSLGKDYASLNRSKGYRAHCTRTKRLTRCTVEARACRRIKAVEREMNSQCKSVSVSYRTRGQRSRRQARRQAMAGWSRKTARLLGENWSRWLGARQTVLRCNRWRGFHVCRATARPCGYGVE